MRYSFHVLLVAGAFFTTLATIALAADAKDDSIKKDRKQIEGTWKVVALEINGNKSGEEDAKKLSVVNGSDGTWSLLSEGREICKGTSTIDPTKKPKTLDFTPTEGEGTGDHYLGIYELGESTRKMCFAPPGKQRPTEFSSTPGSEYVLVTFEREIDQVIKKDRKQIEGTWKVVALQIDGNTVMDEDAKKHKLVFGPDGSWSLKSEENEVSKGTSTIDPMKTPKTIDFTVTGGNDSGKQPLGIYEVGEDTLKFCVAPSGIERPSGFSSVSGSQHVLLTFERDKAK